MEIRELNKTEFIEVASAIGTVTYQIANDGNIWFERLTDGKAVYQHKLLTVRQMTCEALFKKASVEAHYEPSRLKDSTGCTCAFVYESGSFVYYSLVPVTKREKKQADQYVRSYARCLASKRATPLPNQPDENKTAA